jgi:hypothetical protein
MAPSDLFFYAWLITTAIPLGAAIGLTTGWLIGKILHERKRGVFTVLGNLVVGIIGFVLGASISVIDASVNERWENGRLVFRETTGYADYLYSFAVVGAVTLPVLFHLGKAIIKRLPCKKKLKDEERHPINAV